MVGKEELDALPSVALPKGIKLRRELGEVMARRRSGRSYTGDPIDLSYLATVVRSGGAVTSEGTVELLNGDETVLHFRTAPSGGGLYPIDIAVVALRVTGLDRGIYRYDPLGDRLVDIGGRADATALMSAFAVPEDIVSVSRAAAGVPAPRPPVAVDAQVRQQGHALRLHRSGGDRPEHPPGHDRAGTGQRRLRERIR